MFFINSLFIQKKSGLLYPADKAAEQADICDKACKDVIKHQKPHFFGNYHSNYWVYNLDVLLPCKINSFLQVSEILIVRY
jgi:hypothetical protein